MNNCSFFEFTCEGYSSEMGCFRSFEGRLFCAKILLTKMVLLPFSLFVKATLTLFRGIGLLVSILFLIASFGTSEGIRALFLRRTIYLAKDLADWVLFPLTATLSFLKMFLGATLHPGIYFH